MKTSSDNHESASVDDLHDRLIDRGLAEVIGNELPPDLSARILSAQPEPVMLVQKTADVPQTRRRRRWVFAATAASLLIAVAWPISSGHLQRAEISDVAKSSTSASEESRQLEAAYTLERGKINNDQNKISGLVIHSPLPDGTESIDMQVEEALKQDPAYASLQQQLSYAQMSLDQSAKGRRSSRASGGLKRKVEQLQNQMAQYRASVQQAATPADAAAEYVPAFDSKVGANGDSYGIALAKDVKQLKEQLAVVGDLTRPQSLEVAPVEQQIHDLTANGTGPGLSGDQYTRIVENPFVKAKGGAAVSTFSIDVDTASYANVRQFLMQMNQLPPPDAVRIEELVNYFDYNYSGPKANDEAPFAAHVEVAGCPWAADHRLVRIGIKGRELDRQKRPKSNLVFLVDVSGSMDEPSKLPLVVYGLQQLTRELGENDRVAIVVYASSEGLVLPSTTGDKQDIILDALDKLSAGGSTAGGAGIQLAYQIAEDNLIEGGTNRVILCTDGDFNVGVTSTAELERLCEQKAKDTRVFLSVLGFGRGNLNDAMMQAIANRGNGNHYYVDGRMEARRVLVEEMTGTLITIAKDVKIQVEFNPRKVAGYRLIGYENRMLRTEDFNDDKKDAGEIGAGHTVTALYEVVPAGKPVDVETVDDLKYQKPASEVADDAEIGVELLTLKMRYKAPEGDTSKKLEWPVTDDGKAFSAASEDCQFAAAVAGFGMLLRDSQHKGNLTYAAVAELAQSALGEDEHGYRTEFLDMVRKAKSTKGE